MNTPVENILPNTAPDSLATSLVELFGTRARLAAHPEEVVERLSLTDNVVVQGLIVALFVYYLVVVTHYGEHIAQMWKIAVGDNLGIRVADELSYLFMRAVRHAVALGIVAWSLVGVGWLGTKGVESVGGIEPIWLVPIAMAVFAAVVVLQRLLTLGICTLTRREEIAQGLNLLSDTLLALAGLVTTPIALLFVVNTGASVGALGIACIVVASIAMIIFIIKSLIFFIEQNVSILLWILYLCTVVLIPIGIVLTLVARGSAI